MPELLGRPIGEVGYGLMGLTWRMRPMSDEDAFAAMRAALELGCNCWNGGQFYGSPDANSLHLLSRYYAKYPEDAGKVVVNIKGAIDVKRFQPDGSPEAVRRSENDCLKALGDIGRIDIFECARVDTKTPLETTLKTLEEFVTVGKIGGIALSEVSAATIRRAAAITKIAVVEVEVSLWATDIFHNGVAAACAEYDIQIHAYSPIGRGVLAGQIESLKDLSEKGRYESSPRLQPDNFNTNAKLIHALQGFAKRKGCTPAQLAINWLRCQSKRKGNPEIIPIPGASSEKRVTENGTIIELTEDDLTEIDDLLAKFAIVGARVGGPMANYADL